MGTLLILREPILRFSAQGKTTEEIRKHALDVANRFGEPIAGRNGELIEILEPRHKTSAPKLSISAKVGFEKMNFHTDGCHLISPPNFLVFAALEGVEEFPIEVKCLSASDFGELERNEISAASFFVNCGRKSFYRSAMIENEYICYDPYCMEPTNRLAEKVVNLLEERLQNSRSEFLNLKRGELAVLDNRSCFHARRKIEQTARRYLLRIAVS